MHYPAHLLKLIQQLKKLPGVGSRTAERFAFHMLGWPASKIQELAKTMEQVPDLLQHCDNCGCLIGEQACLLCDAHYRSPATLCIVASAKDVFAIEATGEYRGMYHVLGGLLSPFEGRGPETLRLHSLMERMRKPEVKEIIMALDSTLEGDATALFLKTEIESLNLPVSRLAFGLPMGSPLDDVDGGTLARALAGRRTF